MVDPEMEKPDLGSPALQNRIYVMRKEDKYSLDPITADVY